MPVLADDPPRFVRRRLGEATEEAKELAGGKQAPRWAVPARPTGLRKGGRVMKVFSREE
ncbi:hypothetical protein J0H58_06575 [bacterium]|nr:hypothetical protein [bacterium]